MLQMKPAASGKPGRLRAEADRLQAEVNAAFAADDPMMTSLVSDEEISAMADRLADRYAGYIKQAASDLLAGIDRDVDDFIGSRPLKTGRFFVVQLTPPFRAAYEEVPGRGQESFRTQRIY